MNGPAPCESTLKVESDPWTRHPRYAWLPAGGQCDAAPDAGRSPGSSTENEGPFAFPLAVVASSGVDQQP